jgi:methylthioribulose-1-phosphate dehydratase
MSDLPDLETRELLCELLRLFYGKNWVSGTGGGICGPTGIKNLLLAPTGVHKERVQPEDFFVVRIEDGAVVQPATDPSLRPSECNAIFCAIARARGARSVVHSHALSAVLCADLAGESDRVAIERLEMLKGVRGVANRDRHLVPVISNTPREYELTGEVERVLGEADLSAAHAILVRDHGAYIWGEDVWEAKRHTEVYHFLFEAAYARR